MDAATNERNINHFLNKRAVPEESAASEAKPTPTKKPEATPSASASAADKPKSSELSFTNDKSQSITAFPDPTPAASSTTLPFHIKPSITQQPEPTVANTSDTATATASVASSEDDGSAISGGAIGGIVVAIVAAVALSLIAILFVRRKKRRTRRRPSISHRVSSFGQNDFFAGPMATSTATHNLQPSPPMMQQQLQPQTYGSMNVPPMVAAGPVTTPTEYYTPALTAHQTNSTFAPAPAFPAAAASLPMQQQQPQEPWQHPPLGTFTVVSTYTPTLDDEIYVHPGDQVQVYTEYDDGWCLGSNLSRGNARGVFPLHCIHTSTSPSMASSSVTGSAGPGGQNLNPNDPRLSKRGSSLYNYNEVARQF